MYLTQKTDRRQFFRDISLISGMLLLPGLTGQAAPGYGKSRMKPGFVTYQWGKDWDIPTLIENLTKAGLSGVELRVDHAHGVNIELGKEKRKEIRKQFRNSPVEIIGMGTNQQYDFPDRRKLVESVETTMKFIKLSSDIGGSGVKVKPNQFHEGVPKSRTIEQIGRSLNQLASYGADYGQQIRLEVHGTGTQEIENIKAIMDVADHPNAGICWNCNAEDLKGNGLESNFNLLKDRFGSTCHVRELDDHSYPYQELIKLFYKMNYKGWILFEFRTDPPDKVSALISQRKIYEWMVEKAKTS